MVIHTPGPVLEENHYYPFGMMNAQLSSQPITKPLNFYKYNGKELQKELSLDWLDYGARFYDPVLARFHTLDLLAEDYDFQSQYVYAANSPIRFLDILGMRPGDPDDEKKKAASNTAKGVNTGTKQQYQVEPKRGATVTGIRDTKAGRVNSQTGKPVGDAVVRVDNAHPGTNTPHINSNPKITGIADPHTKISSATLKTLEGVGKTIELAGKIATPAAIVTDGVRLTNAFQKDGGAVGENTVNTAGSVAGGWAGAYAGAAVGTKGGAIFGSFFGPGPGTAIGGFVGGLAGGIFGAILGSNAGENSTRNIYEKANNTYISGGGDTW